MPSHSRTATSGTSATYGSNMSGARLAAYLTGGVPPGGSRADPGARDSSPPRRSVPVDLPGGLDGGRHHAGPGHYETLVEVGRLDGVAMLLFTAPHGIDHVEHAAPAPGHLALLAQGLAESRDWDDDRVAAYFERVSPPDQPA